MTMKSLGDFGRYGVQPFCFSYETDGKHNIGEILEEERGALSAPTIRCVAYHTITGGHFDGELRFMMEQKEVQQKGNKGASNPVIIVSVTLAIPKGGRAPPIRLAESMVSSFVESITHSSQIRMKQTLSRRRQSKSYRAQASGMAVQKRHLRFEQEKNQEEMAAERKRRWNRSNPDAGHYRPSGHRLKHPYNC